MADPAVTASPYDDCARMHRESPVHYDARTDLWRVSRPGDLVEAANRRYVFSSLIDMRRAELLTSRGVPGP